MNLSYFFPETEVNSQVYARVTDGLTTADEAMFRDLADQLEQDENKEDAIYIKICDENQVNAHPSNSKLL